jgi:hypothetical protein
MQKKCNAPNNNPPNGTKNGRQKEGNLLPRKLSPKRCFQKEQEAKEFPKYLQKNRKQKYPHHRLIPFITSRLVGSVGPMSPPAKKMLLWIGSPRAMATANAMRTELALRALPQWRSRSTRLEWMGIPSRRRDCEPNEVGWEEGGSMRCRQVGRSGQHL